MAQMPFSPCDDASACTDVSVDILRRIFGSVIDALVTGADPDTVSASGNILASMFGYFNSGILIIGSLIVSYVAIMGTLNTANDGEAMGRNWSSVWTPVRIVAGGAVLLPTASGYSFIQLVVLMFALWGIGFANGTYKTGVTVGVLSPNGIVQGVNHPGVYYGMRGFAQQYIVAAYCARATNLIFADGDHAPQVQSEKTPDNIKTTNGRSEYIFYIKDRNPETNLAGGDAFCGTVSISRYTAKATDDSLEKSMEDLRENLQEKKVSATLDMMVELEKWVDTWPKDNNQSDWDKVDSDMFNVIVQKYEDRVAAELSASVMDNQSGIDSGLSALITALTSDGWSLAGGWFQRVGMVRSQIMNVMSAPVGTVSTGSMVSLPRDARSTALATSVNNVLGTIITKSEEKDTYENSKTIKPESLSSLIPREVKTDISPDSIRTQLDSRMSSMINGLMESVVSGLTGAGSDGTTPMCGTAGQMGGSINRMKCVGDYIAVYRGVLEVADVLLKTVVSALRVVAGVASGGKVLGTGFDADKIVTPIWDWIITVPGKYVGIINGYLEPMAFYFGVFLPSLPYTIFMIVVVGWVLSVLQSIVAAPLWAVMHMTPDRTFVGSQTQGYMLLLSLFIRPALAVIGLFAAILVSDPIIDYIAKAFFSMRGAVVTSTGTVGAIAEFFTFIWWLTVFGLTLLPVLYMCFGLPQVLPDHVLRWIGAGVSDLGETGAVGQMRDGLIAHGRGGRGSGGEGGSLGGLIGKATKEIGGKGKNPPESGTPVNTSPQGVTPTPLLRE